MSMGFFMGIRTSFSEAFTDEFAQLMGAVRSALEKKKIAVYNDPSVVPDVYENGLFGRSALDHHSASVLMSLNEIAQGKNISKHLDLKGDRLIYLPMKFEEPFRVSYGKGFWPLKKIQDIGSLESLLNELCQLGEALGIPFEEGSLSDDKANLINEFKALHDNDVLDYAEDERTAWLVFYEGARLALKHNVALSVA